MAPRIFFRTPLACTRCGTLNEARTIDLSSPLGNDPEWTYAEPGEALDVGPDELEDAFLMLQHPENATIAAIELWTCRSCKLLSPARLQFRARTPHVLEFVGATAIPALAKELLDEAHFLTRKIEEWTPQPGEDETRIEELKRRL